LEIAMHANYFIETLKRQIESPQVLRRHLRTPSRLQSRPQRERPVAVCTRCSAFTFAAHAINQPCSRTRAGNACPGRFASTVAKDAWQKCPTCEATGWQSRMVCSHCQSLGWLFSRKH
jgi:hypothetical protein